MQGMVAFQAGHAQLLAHLVVGVLHDMQGMQCMRCMPDVWLLRKAQAGPHLVVAVVHKLGVKI